MDIHTDISPVLSLIPPTLTILAKALPLPWKVTYTSASSFSLSAERKTGISVDGWKEGNLSEAWKVHCTCVMDEVRIVLQVGSHVMDAYDAGPYTAGWTNLTTATPSRSILRAKLENALTNEDAAQAFISVIDELSLLMKERRESILTAVSND